MSMSPLNLEKKFVKYYIIFTDCIVFFPKIISEKRFLFIFGSRGKERDWI